MGGLSVCWRRRKCQCMLQSGKEELKDLLVSSETENSSTLRVSVQLCRINNFSLLSTVKVIIILHNYNIYIYIYIYIYGGFCAITFVLTVYMIDNSTQQSQ